MSRLRPVLVWSCSAALFAGVLSACVSQPQPVVRPIVTDVPAITEVSAAPAHLPDPVLEIDPGLTSVPARQPAVAVASAPRTAATPAVAPVAPVVVPAAQVPVPAASARPRISTGSHEVPRIDCRTQLSKEDDLVRGAIEQRVQEGSYHAALAQIQSLPAQIGRAHV